MLSQYYFFRRDSIVFSVDVLKEAFKETCVRRGTEFTDKKILEELKNISDSSILEELWLKRVFINIGVKIIIYTNLSCNILLATLKQQFCFAKINNCKKCEMNYNNI